MKKLWNFTYVNADDKWSNFLSLIIVDVVTDNFGPNFVFWTEFVEILHKFHSSNLISSRFYTMALCNSFVVSPFFVNVYMLQSSGKILIASIIWYNFSVSQNHSPLFYDNEAAFRHHNKSHTRGTGFQISGFCPIENQSPALAHFQT